MNKFLLLALLGASPTARGQIVSQFTWDSNPVTQSVVGPNATTNSPTATSSPGGVDGTNGLNAGPGANDLNFSIPYDASFDTDGVDISFDYRVRATNGALLSRGNNFKMGDANHLWVNYRVEAKGSLSSVASPHFPLPANSDWIRCRFHYDPVTGVGTLDTNGVVLWTNDGPDNTVMSWSRNGYEIGFGLDGGSSNVPVYDNFSVVSVPLLAPLSTGITRFEAVPTAAGQVRLAWSLAGTGQHAALLVEQSADGARWSGVCGYSLSSVPTVGHDSSLTVAPGLVRTFYRLRVREQGAPRDYYSVVRVVPGPGAAPLAVYPNPVTHTLRVDHGGKDAPPPQLYDPAGRLVPVACTPTGDGYAMDVGGLRPGPYFLRSGEYTRAVVKR